MTSPHFLLVGNGPYSNRGCEAIVRGTMAILRREFGEEFRVTLGTFCTSDIFAKQSVKETDPLITHVGLIIHSGPRTRRWSLPWWRRQLLRCCLPTMLDKLDKKTCSVLDEKTYSVLNRFCTDASCALAIGGDNYTLDYGQPRKSMSLDTYLRRRGVPVVLWGASVGPFEANPAFATEMFAHLRTMRAIFVRESDSYEYLQQHGISANLYRMSDPAFVMEPTEPPADKIGCPIPVGAIGLNLSPLMARYVTGGDMDAWVKIAADIVQTVVETTRRNVLLIPHVTEDNAFLRRVAGICSDARIGNVSCLGGNLSAAETKWVISRCAAFAGARTHSTIAAISTGVPTLSLAYSRKARGLNQDIFGSQDYCLQPSEITPANVAQGIVNLLTQSEAIVNHLTRSLPGIRESALHSGTILRRLIENFHVS